MLRYAQMKSLVQAYFVEAKWYNSSYTPSMEEYMGNALVTSAYRMLAATSFIGMGPTTTEDAYQWLSNDPKIGKASQIICRLMDDIVSEVLHTCLRTRNSYLSLFDYQYL